MTSSDGNNRKPDAIELRTHLDRVSRELTDSIMDDERLRHLFMPFLPDEGVVLWILERLQEILFPGFHGPRELSEDELRSHVSTLLLEVASDLRAQVAGAIRYADATSHGGEVRRSPEEMDDEVDRIIHEFIDRLPEIRRMLSLDVQAAYDGDPAATHTDEAVICYPGIYAITVHRIAHSFTNSGFR